MEKDYTQPSTNLETLVEIQLKGTLVAVINRDQQKVNLVFWQGWLVEIGCQLIDSCWIPFAVKHYRYCATNEDGLSQELTADQQTRLTSIIGEYWANAFN